MTYKIETSKDYQTTDKMSGINDLKTAVEIAVLSMKGRMVEHFNNGYDRKFNVSEEIKDDNDSTKVVGHTFVNGYFNEETKDCFVETISILPED